jgi:hypothetical protein
MKLIQIKSFLISILAFFLISFLQAPATQAIDLDLTAAQNAVGKRFASKFCEAKKNGFSLESSSEFALNNTYLKFVSFPEDDRFIKDLWDFTIKRIRQDCGNYLSLDEENDLRDFFQEEEEIASNRELYLPDNE